MSTASEQRGAWRGNSSRPASISRASGAVAPQPQQQQQQQKQQQQPSRSPSGVSSPTTPGGSGGGAQGSGKQSSLEASKPLVAAIPAELQNGVKQTPAPAPAGNIWEQRRAAQQAAKSSGGGGSGSGKAEGASAAEAKKAEGQAGRTSDAKSPVHEAPATSTTALYAPVNGFNAVQVRQMLETDASSYKTYTLPDGGPRPPSAASRATMANGQPFFAQLSKQVAQLQKSK